MTIQAFLLGPDIASLQSSLDGLLQCRHAHSLDRSHGSFGLPEDGLQGPEPQRLDRQRAGYAIVRDSGVPIVARQQAVQPPGDVPLGAIPEEHQEAHLQGRIGAGIRFETLSGLPLIPDGVPLRHIGQHLVA